MKVNLPESPERFANSKFLSLDYRPPKWESPIERQLWEALRYMGIGVETQVLIGGYRVDMILSSRLSSNNVIVECDGANFHHNLIDDFRDDELLEIANLPIAHVYGKEIVASPERCALYIAENWFPRLMDTLGYVTTLERVYGKDTTHHVDGTSGFFPVGKVRPIAGDLYPSRSIHRFRYYLRYMIGNISECEFLNDKEQEQVEQLKLEFAKANFPKRKLSPQELARLYISMFYEEPQLRDELQELDNFIENLSKITRTQISDG